MSDIHLMLMEHISPDASSERLRDQIRVRRELLPRMATPEAVKLLRGEIATLEAKLHARDGA